MIVLGAGKAVGPMAAALEAQLGPRINEGLIIVKDGHQDARVKRITLREASHPVPDARGLEATRELIALARGAREEDLVIVLLSGGGSALMEAPIEGISLEQVQSLTQAMLASGQPIGVLNALRRRLSAVKGGKLGALIEPARQLTILISDVIGAPLSTVASGPTSPPPEDDDALFELAASTLHAPEHRRMLLSLSDALVSPRFNVGPQLVLADASMAAKAALQAAKSLGYTATIVDDALQGEAASLGRQLIAWIAHQEIKAPSALIWAGESTVTLTPGHGLGGRNQELALAALLALRGCGVDPKRQVSFASLGTDGSDGPTDATGAIVSLRMLEGADVRFLARALARHDSYHALDTLDALVRTGPTQTNVNDLIIALIV